MFRQSMMELSIKLYHPPNDFGNIPPVALAIQIYLLATGKLNANVAPLPSALFSAHILPP
jgi:hypothetical protein